ncbi:MAG TPA: 50S ribosomal protein L15 [Candidatus Eisenbacteria bacterium]|jgi:large subunit ribosomal protein L15|nr:50S ribosomal protein L15 [Candidatus Eisenbacteria bacterium]
MSLNLHTLTPARGAKRQPKRVGRGNASGKGTTAGRGGKGQTARSGGRNRLKLLGMRHLMLQTPKLRGFKSHHAKSPVVSLGQLNRAYQNGETVSPASLAKKGLVPSDARRVKVLGGGQLKKKLVVKGCVVSDAATELIKAAGGEVRS